MLQLKQQKDFYLILWCSWWYVILCPVYGIVVVWFLFISLSVACKDVQYCPINKSLCALLVRSWTYLKHLLSKSVIYTARGCYPKFPQWQGTQICNNVMPDNLRTKNSICNFIRMKILIGSISGYYMYWWYILFIGLINILKVL